MPDMANLEALIARLATSNFSQTSEPATRELAVNPVIGALGWDTFNPGEVAREHSVRGGKVDYCLRGPNGRSRRNGGEAYRHESQRASGAFALLRL